MLRQTITWLGLALTLLACWWVNQQEQDQWVQETAPITTKPANSVMHTKKPMVAHTLQAQTPIKLRPADTAPPVDLFSALPVQPSADTAQSATLPVPANPYTYEGRVRDGAQWVVFLTDGTQQYSVREGESVTNGWKVSRLTDVALVLQNGRERHTLNLGSEMDSGINSGVGL